MTTKVVTTVVCPNVHRAFISTQSKQLDGSWLKDEGGTVIEIGETKLLDSYITDTRRIVIEEIPLKKD